MAIYQCEDAEVGEAKQEAETGTGTDMQDREEVNDRHEEADKKDEGDWLCPLLKG